MGRQLVYTRNRVDRRRDHDHDHHHRGHMSVYSHLQTRDRLGTRNNTTAGPVTADHRGFDGVRYGFSTLHRSRTEYRGNATGILFRTNCQQLRTQHAIIYIVLSLSGRVLTW